MPLYRSVDKIVFYVHIPKTGGTTIESALRAAGASEALRFLGKREYSRSTLQHMHAEIYLEALASNFHDHAFTVVRHPYSRFCSEYRMKVVDAGGSDDIHSWATECFDRCRQFPYTRDNHIRPQVEFLSDRLEIFRFESGLEAPVERACSVLGLEAPPLPHCYRGSQQPIDVEKRTLGLIHDFYRADFDQLGYDPSQVDGSFRVVN